ncbi:MAG: glycosyltransferase family 2 protein [Cypionkella sp.]|nr:glycosyltransferase family 2 protein [Cypionkella sp.]
MKLAILTVKNEGAFLLDWVAHHRAIGFDHILAFSNDCSDGSDAMLDRLAALGGLTHVPNPGPWEEGPQWAALRKAADHPDYARADWAMVIDIDEYLNILTGDHSLEALIAACDGADAIPVTWRMFGNAGVVAQGDRPITEVFTRAAPAVLHWPWRALMVKTLFRTKAFRKPGVHRPKGPVGPVRLSDPGLGQRLFSAPGQDHTRLAQINHYALGAMEDYIVKCDRGRANREGAAFDMSYWCDRNFTAEEDRSILAVDSTGLRAALRADPILGELHRAAVAWRQARFAELMAEEPWRALFGRLLMTPPARILGPEEAALIRRHRQI